MQGLAELCVYKVQTLQCTLGDLSRQYVYCILLQQHIGSQRQQHRKLDRHLQKLGSKMDTFISQLLAWVAQLRHHRHHLNAVMTRDPVVATAVEATRVRFGSVNGELHACLVHGYVDSYGKDVSNSLGAWLLYCRMSYQVTGGLLWYVSLLIAAYLSGRYSTYCLFLSCSVLLQGIKAPGILWQSMSAHRSKQWQHIA